MIKRWIILLLAVQAGAALALAAVVHQLWRPAWLVSLQPPLNAPLTALAYLAIGLASVLLVRLALSVNNFLLSSRAGKGDPTPAAHALNPASAASLFLHEFGASMLASTYYMLRPLGMQLQPNARGLPVLLIHGYACNSGYWRPLSAQLARAGISHYGIDLEPPGASIDAYAPQVQAAIERLCAATGSKQVIIVGHSMGGLVARAWLRRYGAAAVARVITLGTPHHGTALAHLGPGGNAVQMRYRSEWLAALAASEANLQRSLFSSIYSVHDNIVAPQDSGALPGARNLVFGAIGHVALGRHPVILRCALDEIAAVGGL